ncbi:DUF4870 domain-containing protein [Brevibacillus sp. TJ4]|uniref:DUF4870 domain-containing protein n=1 Tax=Brevibacillus sp. TJ4 TaxID=3234853 RepID=UPI0037CE7E42
MNAHSEIVKEERIWAIVSHLSALCSLLIPLGNVIGPLVIWLIKRESSPYVAEHAKEALNFNISITLYSAFATLLLLVYVGVVLLTAIFLFWLISLIIAAMRANDNKMFRYRLSFRFIK